MKIGPQIAYQKKEGYYFRGILYAALYGSISSHINSKIHIKNKQNREAAARIHLRMSEDNLNIQK